MTGRGAMRGVLHNFLGTFASRYSDYDGYWLFGFLVADLERRRVDLMADEASDVAHSPWNVADALARAKFREQTAKAGVALGAVTHAELAIERLSGSATALINTETWQGFNLRFSARATMDSGRSFERDLRVFVAPHSPRELRSTRRNVPPSARDVEAP